MSQSKSKSAKTITSSPKKNSKSKKAISVVKKTTSKAKPRQNNSRKTPPADHVSTVMTPSSSKTVKPNQEFTFPVKYTKAEYIQWHEFTIFSDKPLLEGIERIRTQLKSLADAKLPELGQLLEQVASRTEPECEIQTKGLLSGEYELPLDDLDKKTKPAAYEQLFKSTDSILDKMWRRNNGRVSSEMVTLSNLRTEIRDLVRMSVVAPTLLQAKMYSDRLSQWETLFPKPERDKHFPSLLTVKVDGEAKLASGYFAYHAMIEFTDTFFVEVQIYSSITSAWRHISHKVYEKARLGLSPLAGIDSPETALVSLGHTLQVVETMMSRLINDLKPS